MSLKKKIEAIRKECLAEFSKKRNEIQQLTKNLEYLINQARKEIMSESERISSRMHSLEREEDRITKYKDRTEQDMEILREKTERRIDSHINDVMGYLEELRVYGKEPKLIDAYINACYILDEKLAKYYESKRRPNVNASEAIRAYKKENKGYLQRIMDLEYQISELWAKDADTSEKESFEFLDDDDERVRSFLTASEYQNLTESERNQRALDNYLNRKHSNAHIGKMYERYIGYLYECKGYNVEYRGIEMGLKDGGIDLICRKQDEILLVQCKNWKLESTIYEKHICQLYGASRFYDKDHVQEEYKNDLFAKVEEGRAIPVFITTTKLDDHATEVANTLGVAVKYIPFDKSYPMIKCNINNNEKIYHLPIDQMYDKTKICKKGERWVRTIEEAENYGFRRAMRHFIKTVN